MSLQLRQQARVREEGTQSQDSWMEHSKTEDRDERRLTSLMEGRFSNSEKTKQPGAAVT